MKILNNVSLKTLHTFHTEVNANYYVEIRKEEDIFFLLNNETFKENKRLIIGEGSDILFIKDFEGLVIKDNIKGIDQVFETDDYVWIHASSGENWHSFVEYCVKNNWGGLENLALIPGNVGAAPIQNIGAYGSEIKDSLHSLEAIDFNSGEVEIFLNEDCKFAYRWSIFKKEDVKNRYYIISATFKLKKNPIVNIEYLDLKNELINKDLNIQNVFQAVIDIRRRKLPDPKELGNAGSFFKNPIIDISDFEQMKLKFPELKGFLAGERIKLAAAQLIDLCEWKNQIENDVGVYKNQALVIVNYGTATGTNIHQFALKIIDSVKTKFGVVLEPEVNIY